jgi:hypothetical protein
LSAILILFFLSAIRILLFLLAARASPSVRIRVLWDLVAGSRTSHEFAEYHAARHRCPADLTNYKSNVASHAVMRLYDKPMTYVAQNDLFLWIFPHDE